ncbi:MAG: 16S rRNA (guanine(966)-N(2))-methyltransferase RsmD [Rhodospirillales bacterium]
MRIVAGRHRGRAIAAPAGGDIRPTSDRARQAVFDLLAHHPQTAGKLPAGAEVLDAFAGTGAMGLEALSRGALRATFMDAAPAAVACIRANAAKLGEAGRVELLRADAAKPPAARTPATLAFLDPPYGKDVAEPALEALARKGWFADDAVVVVEHDARRELKLPPGFAPFDRRRWGRARFLFLRYHGREGAGA